MFLPFHAHFDFPLPGAAIADLLGLDDGDQRCHIDLLALDTDADGDLEIEVRWNLPGTAFDSGPEPARVELPTAAIVEGHRDAVGLLLDGAGMPGPVAELIKRGAGDLLSLTLRGLNALRG